MPLLQQGLDVAWEGCELLLDQPQVWPGGIAVLEASHVPPPLLSLHARLGERLRRWGWRSRRGAIGRTSPSRARRRVPGRPRDAAPLRWRTGTRYALVHSLPGGRGYTPLQCLG